MLLSVLSVTLVYCGQVIEWIRMPLGTEVGLGPSDIVLDGDPAPPPRKGAQQPPTFRAMSIVAKQSPVSETAELLSIRQLNFALKAMPLLKTKPGIKFGNVPVHVESQLAISTCSDSSNLSAKVCDLDSVMEFGLYSTVSKIRRVWSTKVESLDFLARLYRFGDMKAHILLIQIAFFSTQHVGLFDPPRWGYQLEFH